MKPRDLRDNCSLPDVGSPRTESRPAIDVERRRRALVRLLEAAIQRGIELETAETAETAEAAESREDGQATASEQDEDYA